MEQKIGILIGPAHFCHEMFSMCVKLAYIYVNVYAPKNGVQGFKISIVRLALCETCFTGLDLDFTNQSD